MKIVYTDVFPLEDKGLLKNIEYAGRVCYKSEDKITDESALRFVNMIRSNLHYSVLEHGSVYLISSSPIRVEEGCISRYTAGSPLAESPWCHIEIANSKFKYYTNFRVIQEACPSLAQNILDNNLPKGIQAFVPEDKNPYKRLTFKIISDLKIGEQYLRHRVLSPSQESTRYCNYAKDKFDSQITFCLDEGMRGLFGSIPGTITSYDDKWLFTPDYSNMTEKEKKDATFFLDNIISGTKINANPDQFIVDFSDNLIAETILSTAYQSEHSYKKLSEEEYRPETIRAILPCCTKTETVLTGFRKDWEEVVAKRNKRAAQTEARIIAKKLDSIINPKKSENIGDLCATYFKSALDGSSYTIRATGMEGPIGWTPGRQIFR